MSDPGGSQVELSAEDEFLVLGCDGLFELCSSQDLCNYIRGVRRAPANRG